VKRSEKVAASERRDDNPLLVNDLAVYPNLGDPVSKAAVREVGFYFAIYPAGDQSAPQSEIQLLRNGDVLAKLPVPPAARVASGRIPQVGRLPLDQLAPGTYQLVAVVKQGSEQVSRSTILRVTE